MAEYLNFNGMDNLGNEAVTKEHGFKSEVRELRLQYNKLAQVVSLMMPGVLTSAPGLKGGTSSAVTWRHEACTAKIRGKAFTISAAETALTDTGHDTAHTKESWYVLSVQADGSTHTITKGADQTIGTIVLPQAPDNEMVLGYMQIVTIVGTAFDANTDDLAVGTGIASLAFYDAPYIETVNVD